MVTGLPGDVSFSMSTPCTCTSSAVSVGDDQLHRVALGDLLTVGRRRHLAVLHCHLDRVCLSRAAGISGGAAAAAPGQQGSKEQREERRYAPHRTSCGRSAASSTRTANRATVSACTTV